MAGGVNALGNLLGKVNSNNALVVALDGGTASATLFLAGDGTASAPSYSFASSGNSDTGWFLSAGGDVRMSIDGTARHVFQAAGYFLLNDSGALFLGSGSDVSFSRGAANRLDLATLDSFNLVGGGASYMIAAVPVFHSTAPTVTSAGTNPSVSGTNTAAFRVNVGTGGTATTIVLAMPTATTGWNCYANYITGSAANRANQQMVQQSSTTTAVTVQNQTISTGAALAFTASDIVAFQCVAY